jgi:hypothetical protein
MARPQCDTPLVLGSYKVLESGMYNGGFCQVIMPSMSLLWCAHLAEFTVMRTYYLWDNLVAKLVNGHHHWHSNYDQLECMINIIKCSIFFSIFDLAKVANLCLKKEIKHWNKSHTFSNFLLNFFILNSKNSPQQDQ